MPSHFVVYPCPRFPMESLPCHRCRGVARLCNAFAISRKSKPLLNCPMPFHCPSLRLFAMATHFHAMPSRTSATLCLALPLPSCSLLCRCYSVPISSMPCLCQSSLSRALLRPCRSILLNATANPSFDLPLIAIAPQYCSCLCLRLAPRV